MPPLFSTFTPVTVTNPYAGSDPMFMWLQNMSQRMVGGATSASGSSSSSASGGIGLKDTLSLLKDMKGLDSDVSSAISAIQQASTESAILGGAESLLSDYYRNINLANKVNQSKAEYDEAYKLVKEKDGIQEAAVTSDGRVIVREKGNNQIQAVDPSEYFKNRNKYQIQTNGELLYARAHDKNMAFNNSVLSIVQNGTSMSEISKFVNDFISKLGTSSQPIEGYTAKQAQKILGGVQALQDASKENIESMPIDGIYKVKLKSSTQNEQASYAISAIYNSLNANQKALLKMHSNGKDSGALELIKEMVMKDVSVTKEFSVDYQKEMSEKAGLSGNGAAGAAGVTDGKDKSGVAGNWFLGYGEQSKYVIQDESNQGIETVGNDLPITDNGQSIGISTLEKAAKSDFGGVLDFDKATMGNGVKLDPFGSSKVVINGTKIVGVELPVDPRDPDKPYFALLKKKSEADAELRQQGISSPDASNLTLAQKQIVNQVYKNKGLPEKFDSSGNPNTNSYRRFGMITGTTTKDAFLEDNDLNISGMKQVTSKNERENYQSVRRETSGDKKYSIDNGYLFGWLGVDELYKGTIFIPVRNNYFNAISSGGASTYPTTAQAIGIEQAQQQTDAILNTINTQKLQ